MKHKNFNKSLLCLAVLAAYSSISYASIVRGDVDYQVFRNFAENKGQFQAGATNIPVYNKNGQLLGNAFSTNVPMPDFSAVEKNTAVATLAHPQYISSVKHNKISLSPAHGFTFGTTHKDQNGVTPFTYLIVNRNDHPHDNHDFNTPRLNKMVTEVESLQMAPNLTFDDFRNGRFSDYARVGSGRQGILNDQGVYEEQNSSYQFLAGGTPSIGLGSTDGNHENDSGDRAYYMVATKRGTLNELMKGASASPLATYIRPGDSGSPVLGFDRKDKRWYIVGFGGRSVRPNQDTGADYPWFRNFFALAETNVFERTRLNNLAGTLAYRQSSDPVYWERTSEGASRITHRNQTAMNVPLANNGNLDHGKDLVIAQDARDTSRNNKIDLVLRNDINQGAGGLYFTTSGKVRGQNPNTTWVGSGVFVDEGKQVEWQVKNPSGDRISKLGRGELLVNGSTVNEGSISVGAGTVTLAQKASGGKKQAFKEVQLASGRGSVVIADADQLKHTKLSFGHRGGTLDLNNNNLTLDRIHHMDDGATITNRKTSYRVLTVNSEGVQNYKGSLGHQGGSHLSLNYSPKGYNGTFAVSGDVNLKGYIITNKNAKLVFTGAPNQLPALYSPIMVDSETDWKNRKVTANSSFYVRGSGLIDFGRNLSEITGMLRGSNRGTFRVGFVNNESLNCLYSTTECEKTQLNQETIDSLPTTQANSNVELREQSQLIVGKANLKGGIDASGDTLVRLENGATWTLTRNSTLGSLRLEKGSKVHLNPDNEFNRFNNLAVNKHLSGNGYFRFSTNLANLGHNKLILNGRVEGRHTISLLDSGQEPNLTKLRKGLSGIRLIEMPDTVPQRNATFVLENGYIDAGAYRYVLNQGNFDFTETAKVSKPEPQPKPQPPVYQPPVRQELPKPDNSNNINNSSGSTVDNQPRIYTRDELIKMLMSSTISISEYFEHLRVIRDAERNTSRYSNVSSRNSNDEGESTNNQANVGRGKITSRHADDGEEGSSHNNQQFDESKYPEDELVYPEDELISADNEPRTTLSKDIATNQQFNGYPEDELISAENEPRTTLSKDIATQQFNGYPEDELVSAENEPRTALATSSQEVAAVRATGSQAEVMSAYANQGVNNTANAQRIASQGFESLIQQGVRSSQKSANTWVSVQKQHHQAASSDYRGQKQDRTQTQVGTAFSQENTTVGIAYTDNRASKNDNVKSVGAYVKHQWDNHLFTMLDAQYGRAKAGEHRQNIARIGATAGAELKAGKASLTPYAGVAVSRFSASNYTLDGANIQVNRQVLPTYHAGVKADYQFDLGNVNLKPFVAAHYVASNKKQAVRVNNAEFNQRFDNRLSYQAGMEMNMGKFSLSAAAGTTKGRELKRERQFELKASFTW